MQDEIAAVLTNILVQMGVTGVPVEVTVPINSAHGDYSTNVALKAAKLLKKSPLELALSVKRAISSQLSAVSYGETHQITDQKHQSTLGTVAQKGVLQDIERVEVVAPGFINFYLTESTLITHVMRLLKSKESYGSVQNESHQSSTGSLKPKRIVIEFTDPNPFKEFHIGHLYSNAVGESLSRLFQYSGNTVRRVNYQGDVGMHVAKSVWGMMQKLKAKNLNLKSENSLSEVEKRPLSERVKWLGQCYAMGATAYEKDAAVKEEMQKLNFLIFISAQNYLRQTQKWTVQVNYRELVEVDESELALAEKLYQKGRKWSLDYFEDLYKVLGTKFDAYYFESQVSEYGIKIVRDHIKDGIFEKSDGAIVFRGEKFGLHTRVFINALGLPTYETKELGLAPSKFKDWPYDLSYIVTGKEISEYFNVILAALRQINPELASKTHHIGHGIVRLPQGKMSSRTGNVLTGEWLLSQARHKIYDYLQNNTSKYTKEQQEQITQLAAVAAVKYSLLRVGIPADIAFDLDKSVSFEGDSGPYLQYTYARCRSVADKAYHLGINTEKALNIDPNTQHLSPAERQVMRTLLNFPQAVSEATQACSPSHVCTYLANLAQEFNLFYAKHSILGTATITDSRRKLDQPEVNLLRLAITLATAQVIKTGLWLLGIETLERM